MLFLNEIIHLLYIGIRNMIYDFDQVGQCNGVFYHFSVVFSHVHK